MDTLAQQRRLIEALRDPRCYDHPVEKVELIETHISWVLLTGRYAYKVKKGVDFGFLDYATLEKRKHQCEEELRLNRRTAPQLYLQVVSIGGNEEAPVLHREPAIEYAVVMQQFAQQALLSRVAERGELAAPHAIALAEMLAAFHAGVDVAPDDSPFGSPDAVYHPVEENFAQVRERLSDAAQRQRLDTLEQQSHAFFVQHRKHFSQRKVEGFIRDCHGDLHLNNILLRDDDGAPLLFDCIEFNPNLRIIDVISELAFLLMDLEEHGRGDLAGLLLNRYLELSGDYAGLRLLRFYQGYRAMVRAKVATLRLDQPGVDAATRATVESELCAYLDLAEAYARPARPRLLITHGLSGSGKSTVTQQLLTLPGVVRLRSDLERKRLFGLAAEDSSHSAPGEKIYSADASRRTYQRLRELATAALEGGYSVIVDATFLQRGERDTFRQLAREQSIPFTLLHFEADTATLQRRIAARAAKGYDPSEADNAVLQAQLAHYQPLGADEVAETLPINSEAEAGVEAIRALLRKG
jgi:aminoglycoside phosphotransferase family enzyme/predicted kinase